MKKQRKLQIKIGILCCFLLCAALFFYLSPALHPVRARRSAAVLEKISIPDRVESVFVPPVLMEAAAAPTEEIGDTFDEREVTCLIFIRPPTAATEGAVGELGMDIRTGELYKCISVSDTAFVWERLSTPSVVQTPGSSDSAVMSQQAVSEFFKKRNLPVSFTLTDGYFSSASGKNQAFNYAQHSDFIPVKAGEEYTLTTRDGANVPAAVFFSEAAFGTQYCIDSLGDITAPEGYRTYSFTVPQGAAYMVVNFREPARLGNNPTLEKASTEYIGNIDALLSALQGELDAYATLKGKTIVNLGDSIFGQEVRPERFPVSDLLSRYTGATVINCAFGGTRMVGRGAGSVFSLFDFPAIAQAIVSGDFSPQENALLEDSANAIAYQYDRNLPNLVGVNWSEVDVITLNYGTNDYTAGTSLALFKAAAIENMGKIMEKYPHITFVLITPTWRFWYNSDGTFLEDSNTRVIAGSTRQDFCEASAEIAKDLNIPLVNAQDIGINRFNFKYYFPTNELDGTHHSVEGRERLAKYLAAQLMSIL